MENKNLHKSQSDKKRYNIKEVAILAGVSVATVSNVISGIKYVSPELKEKVSKVIKQLDYRPSKIARGLKMKKTFQIGVLVTDITNPFFAEVVRGIESIVLKEGYQMFLCNTDGNIQREEEILRVFLEPCVDGIINVAPRMDERSLRNFLDIPTVIVDRPISVDNQQVGNIYADNISCSAQLAKYFIKKGHKTFACIAGPKHVPNVQKRIYGFRKELENAGVSKENILFLYGEFKHEDGYKLMNKLLNCKLKPTCVFLCSDIMAWGALEAIKKRGLKIPEDVAIAGFDNNYFSKLLNPPLTTIHQPKFKLGGGAAKILIDIINNKYSGKYKRAREVVLDSKLIIREST